MTSLVKIAKTTLASAAVVALTAQLTFAQSSLIPNDCGRVIGTLCGNFGSMDKLITFIFHFVTMAAGTIFVLMFLFGGIQYLTSAGNEEGSTKARKLLVDAMVGLIIVLAAYAIGTFVLAQVGIHSSSGPLYQ